MWRVRATNSKTSKVWKDAKIIISSYLQLLLALLVNRNIFNFECFEKLTFFQSTTLKIHFS